ncbi:PAS domain S-box protein [Scytonema sp. UIC 10036]|uniref:PAS domain S-box protein n=1 Tax=Scytonema sp. UIC 10036 TaxID=2304196 RepID=UPI0012DA7B8C|nr:PAS domain S-box protein [Scytonema sp. UIC 10036]MUG96414.1 PAS domain S-box protein [Scytonema sp. UIC 10036]
MDSQRTIFIIDDCKEDRMVYRRLLERDTRYTYKVVEFESAAEAIESCKSWIPDLIFIDFMLPDATGVEFLEELKLSTDRKHLPVIMLTGQGDESVAVQAMKSGAQDYLVKGKLTDDTFYRASYTVMERVRLMQQVDLQQEQQRLIAAIALRIRLSLSLEIVLNTAVEEIRDFLKADRVIVYQFHPDKSGTIVAESVVSGWKSCLNVRVEDTCFQGVRGSYHRSRPGAVNDTHQAVLSDCYVELLKHYQVRANLYVPIFSGIQPVEADRCLLRNEPPVWGLLIAHQCGNSRQWQQSEMDLLEQLSVQLAIAIQQAELYENLRCLNAQLEAKVLERTVELQQSERKFRAIFEQTFQLIGLLTPQGTILELNQAFLEFFGAECDRLRGLPFWELSCYKISPTIHDSLQKAIALASVGNFVRYEVTLPNARGIQRTIDVSIKPILNEMGEVVLLLPEGRDITERKQAEEALCDLNEELEIRVQQRTQDLEQANINLRSEIAERQRVEDELRRSEEKFRQLAQKIREVFFIFNHDLSETIYISPAYEEIWGQSCSSMYQNSLSWLNLVHPEDKDSVILSLDRQRYIEGFRQEYRILRDDGDIRWIRTQSFLVRNSAGAIQRIVGIAEDITESKRTETELQRRQQEFLALVENAPDIIARIERDYRYLYINPAVQAASGLPRQAFIGKTTGELGFPKETVIQIELGVKQVFETGQEHFIEFSLDGLNGLKHYQARMVPERNSHGDLSSVLLMSRDITLLKQTEMEMRETNALLQAIIQSAPVGIDLVDTDGNVVLWNPMSERLFGWKAQEVLGKPLPIVPNEAREKFIEFVHQTFAGQGITQVETQRQRKDGSLIDISLSTALVRDIQGNVIGGIGICQDISERQAALRERKQAELELLRNRDLREAIFNESADAIFLVDEDTRRIIDCNRRAIKLFEASSKEELINDDRHTLQHYPLTFQELEKLTEEVKKKGFWSREIEYKTLKGNSFWGNLAVKQISIAGTVRNLVRVTDISDRKQAVDQLEHSLEEKETLLKEIHHRVKNNLQIISSLLRMQSRRARDESTMVLFQESQNRVQSMALIHEHLYQSPEISQIDFGEYIRSLTDNLFRCYGISQKAILLKIETGGIKLNLDTAIPCGLLINELVSNSLKYAFPKGRRGEIAICLVSATDNTITLTVSDTGIGIPESLDWNNTNSLGLRIVHNLTRQLKGTLTLERNHGTAFHITFSQVLKT